MLSDYPNELLKKNGVPDGLQLLVGCTRDEANTFDASQLSQSAKSKALGKWVATEYDLKKQEGDALLSDHYPEAAYAARGSASKSYLRAVALETDQDMRCALRRGAAKATADSYVYQFDRGVGGTNFANHADDIPFVFSATEALDAAGAVDEDRALQGGKRGLQCHFNLRM